MTTETKHEQRNPASAVPEPAPYTNGYVQAGPVRLHYLDYGTEGKPPMLCIHGSAAHAHWFDFVAPGFNTDYHMRAFDLRGHGESDPVDPAAYVYEEYAADIEKAVTALGLRDFVLVGHSMGGIVSLVYTATYPERVRKLVIVDSTVNLSAERIARMRDVGARPGRDFQSKEEMVSRYKLRPGTSHATPEVVRYIGERSITQNDDGTWRYKFDRAVYATRQVFDGTPLWSEVKVPLLIVMGQNSGRITPEVVARVKARAPQVHVEEVARSDHHVTLDNPQGFIDAVKPWLART